MSREQVANVVAFIFFRNDMEPSDIPMAGDPEQAADTPLPWE